MSMNALIPALFGIIGLIAATIIYQRIRRYPTGDAKVAEIGDQIHLGAMVFMRREYTMLAWFCLVLIVVLWFFLGYKTALSFIAGAVASAAAGLIGMRTATRANVRTTVAAHTRGRDEALAVAFFGGSIMGLAVASLGLLGLGTLTSSSAATRRPRTRSTDSEWGPPASPCSRASGAASSPRAPMSGRTSSARSKRASPRTTPANAGVIADNVGDNVGDVAGMGSDIFESYCGSMIASIAIASTMVIDAMDPLGERPALMFLPLALALPGSSARSSGSPSSAPSLRAIRGRRFASGLSAPR